MTLITPDLIEKAAEAIELAMWNEPSSEALARAALQAVLPDVVEKCAQVALTQRVDGESDFAEGADNAAVSIAALIRALIPQEGK